LKSTYISSSKNTTGTQKRALTAYFLGPDPVQRRLEEVLSRIDAGEPPRLIESAQVDVKEERGRRDRSGQLQPGRPQNDEAAKHLAEEMACFANTPGGGAIILGVGDDGTVIGTEIEVEWLRKQIYDLTDRKLTIHVKAVELRGERLLILQTHEAIEPIKYRGRLKHRVDDNCVEIDPTSWYARKMGQSGVDWSAQRSGHAAADVKATALEIARGYLAERGSAGDETARDLAAASDHDLLRRIHVLDGDGYLTNAGSLLFVRTPHGGLDYRRRDHPGADSIMRVPSQPSQQPLVQQIHDVEFAFRLANRTIHLPSGLAHGQTPAIPHRAFREALINGVVHRDWLSDATTEVEHVGDTVTITSPGGFLGGVQPGNIITHPATPRYRSLAEAVKFLRLSEREGIGVDRMVCDMLSLGHRNPGIEEISGPYVRVSLHGGDPDRAFVGFMAATGPLRNDVEALLLIAHLITTGWVDVKRAMPVFQRTQHEAEGSLARLMGARADGKPVFQSVRGIPSGDLPASRLSDYSREQLRTRLEQLNSPGGRETMVLDWAQCRGRVSSTEASDLAGISVTHAGTLLSRMAEDGLLKPGREKRRGRGFFYAPAEAS
jgi:ATP-dependent DNA helicase RecG